MNESDEKNKSVDLESDKSTGVDKKKGVVLDLDFAPSWARTSPEDHLKSVKSSRFDSDGGGSYNRRSSGRDNRRGGGGQDDRFSRNSRDTKKFDRSKPPRRREFGQDRPPALKPHDGLQPTPAAATSDTVSPPRTTDFRDRGSNNYRPQGRGNYRDRPQYEQHPPLALEVRVLPEQKALGGVIRRIQSSHRAFPLRDIAWLFLDKPASCLIRLSQQKEDPIPLFQCKICGMPALSEEEMESHLLNRHLDDAFDVEEIECEMPGGQFVCVMRCGMTGELLGPPNHHSYNTKVHEMLRTKFPNMSEEAYRRKIESVRDSEIIEEWRKSCTKKKIYRRKTVQPVPAIETPVVAVPPAAEGDSAPAAEGEAVVDAVDIVVDAVDSEIKSPPMERDVAELVFKREIMPKQYSAVKHMICIASTALQTPNKRLYYAIKDMLLKERRFPTSLFFALRGAFRHRKLHLFRANEAKGPDFVMQKKPYVLDPSHAVDMVKDVLSFIHDHPACTKIELVHALSNDEEGKIKETLAQLAWLIEKGNVIEYYNDVLSAPVEYPSFKLLAGEKKRGKRGESVAAVDATSPASDEVAAPALKTTEPDVAKSDPVAADSVAETDAPEKNKVAEPVVETKVEPVVEPKVEPVVEPKVEPVVEPKVEPVVEPKVEPVVEPKVEPVVEPVADVKVEAAAEPAAKPKKSPAAKPKAKTAKPKVAKTAAEGDAPAAPKAKAKKAAAPKPVIKEEEAKVDEKAVVTEA